MQSRFAQLANMVHDSALDPDEETILLRLLLRNQFSC
jgi:hypothetical protein